MEDFPKWPGCRAVRGGMERRRVRDLTSIPERGNGDSGGPTSSVLGSLGKTRSDSSDSSSSES